MRKQDNQKFSELMAILSETYKPFSSVKEKIWATVFKNHEIEDFEKAIFKHITDENKGTFEPKPADILRFMPEPKQLLIESKGSLGWCDNTHRLLKKYHPVTGSYFAEQRGLTNAT
tara:strand:- start:124 stop:471 length:348 start_codon:yes stop_codon:yes gene_type:complete